MTAEIAIMNPMAVALAADSASTVVTTRRNKNFNTANKLFALSKYRPVGIMIYGNASFMGIPFESLIKVYREKLEDRGFGTLQQYAGDFLSFLGKGDPLIPETVQADAVRNMLTRFLIRTVTHVDSICKEWLREGRELSESDVQQAVNQGIEQAHKRVTKHRLLPEFPEQSVSHLVAKYGTIIDEIIQAAFQRLPISAKACSRLREACGQFLCRSTFDRHHSGIVVAGFGEDEIYPSIHAYAVDSVVDNTLRYLPFASHSVTFDQDACIMPFAQTEMVHAFIEGVDPNYQKTVDGYVGSLFDRLPEYIIESLSDLADNDKPEVRERLGALFKRLVADFEKDMADHRREHHSDPIISSVAILPKDELASVAEALISLTSLKRRISIDESETVGGPIDVAVISKGDGLIWIRRKHYFNPDLNHHFFANYYRRSRPREDKGGEDGEGQERSEANPFI